jgi:cardiolipin synthase
MGLPQTMNFLKQFRAAPNLLTLLRLFIIPFLVIAILDGRYRGAFALFVLAGVSDACDGLLARMLSQHTRLGQYLDPIADKLLLSTLFLVLTHMGLVPRYVTVLVFSRDLGILLISTLLFATGTLRDFRPSLLGKLNTVAQIAGLTAVLVAQIAPSADGELLRGWLLRAIAALAPVSAAQYAWIVFRKVSGAEPGEV